MAHSETKENKSGRRSGKGIGLVILLLILGAIGFLVCSVVMAPLQLDDPQAMAASAPMSVGERFRFSAADGTAQIKLDKGDLWSFILDHEGNDFLDQINEELSAYSLSVSGCGMQLDEDMLQMNLEMHFKKIRLAVKVPCDLEIKGGHMVVKPTGVKLGVISLPVEEQLSDVEREYDMKLPVIDDVSLAGLTKDGILVTGSVDQNIHGLVSNDDTFQRVILFSKSMQNLVNLVQEKVTWKDVLLGFEEDPANAEEFYEGIFMLSDDVKRKIYLENRDDVLTRRLFPGLDFSDIKKNRNDLILQLGTDVALLKEFFTDLFDDYNDKKFKLSDGEFFLDDQPFHAGVYSEGKYGDLFEKLDPDRVFLILVDAYDGYVRHTDPLKRMTDKKQQFTQEVDFNKSYILGCVIFAESGDPFLVYDADIHLEAMDAYIRRTMLHPLTQEEVEALQVPGQFGVWTK